MNLDVYAIKDLKKGKYATPYFVPFGTEPKELVVGFERDLKKGVMQLFLDPKEYELWFLGFLDVDTGVFHQEDMKIIVTGSSIAEGLPVQVHRKGEESNGVVDLEDGEQN